MDKMVHRNFFHDVIGHVIQQSYCLKKQKKTSKTFSEVAEQIEMKLYTYDRLSMRNKRFTQMMSLVTRFGSHIGFILKPTKKKIFFSRTAGQIEGKLHKSVPQARGVQVY